MCNYVIHTGQQVFDVKRISFGYLLLPSWIKKQDTHTNSYCSWISIHVTTCFHFNPRLISIQFSIILDWTLHLFNASMGIRNRTTANLVKWKPGISLMALHTWYLGSKYGKVSSRSSNFRQFRNRNGEIQNLTGFYLLPLVLTLQRRKSLSWVIFMILIHGAVWKPTNWFQFLMMGWNRYSGVCGVKGYFPYGLVVTIFLELLAAFGDIICNLLVQFKVTRISGILYCL